MLPAVGSHPVGESRLPSPQYSDLVLRLSKLATHRSAAAISDFLDRFRRPHFAYRSSLHHPPLDWQGRARALGWPLYACVGGHGMTPLSPRPLREAESIHSSGACAEGRGGGDSQWAEAAALLPPNREPTAGDVPPGCHGNAWSSGRHGTSEGRRENW